MSPVHLAPSSVQFIKCYFNFKKSINILLNNKIKQRNFKSNQNFFFVQKLYSPLLNKEIITPI